jgi:hypothetical protein
VPATKVNTITKIHLVISVLVVVPVAFIYGFNPDLEFDIQLKTIDEHNQFKAIMGLYLGFSVLWTLGILKANYLRIALVTNTVFMLSLGFARLLSWFLDGAPTFAYQYGTFAELLLGFYGFWVLNSKYYKKT